MTRDHAAEWRLTVRLGLALLAALFAVVAATAEGRDLTRLAVDVVFGGGTICVALSPVALVVGLVLIVHALTRRPRAARR